jgi:hypothetical protein
MLQAIRIVENTKETHDHWESGQTFEYDKLVENQIPAIGIPAQNNRLLIIDVDTGGTHQYDGRKEWGAFAQRAGIPATYTVQTASGGYHFYFRLPDSMDLERFAPLGKIFPGVDVKFRGYVLAPPTKGYTAIHGTHDDIVEAPPSLIAQVQMKPVLVNDLVGVNTDEEQLAHELGNLAKPLSSGQVERLRKQLDWIQQNISLDYDQWFRGLCSLKAGIHDDPELLEELATKWTMNQGYREGDEIQAMSILEGRKTFGGIGPGAIFEIIKDVTVDKRDIVPIAMLSKGEVLEASGVNFILDKNTGIPKVNPCETNIAAIINSIPEFSEEQLYFDTRMDSYIHKGEQIDDQTVTDIVTPQLQSFKNGLGFENFKRVAIHSALQVLMTARRKDPHIEWMKSLQWDGVERIKHFFPKYLYTKDTEYEQALGQNLWIALAARGLAPGSKMDNVIIIEGEEGIRKSTLIEVIGGDYYVALSSDERINSQEALRKMHQSAVVEIPELVGLINREGEAIKAILTTNRDRMRSLYARKAMDRKRGFVILGTTNSGEYLTDSMGERRFWPVKVPREVSALDIEGVKRDREQLFAEGLHKYNQGISYWTVPKKSWQKEIDQRKHHDPLMPVVEDLTSQTQYTTNDIYHFLYMRDFISRVLTRPVSERIASILRMIGCRKSGSY